MEKLQSNNLIAIVKPKMKTEQKKIIVKRIKEVAEKNKAVLILHYRGMNDFQLTDLRKSLKSAESGLIISKNTLAKIGFCGTSVEKICDKISGPTAFVYSNDIFKASSIISTKLQEYQKMSYISGIYENNTIDYDFIKTISSLGSEEQVRAKFISTIKIPAAKFISYINQRQVFKNNH